MPAEWLKLRTVRSTYAFLAAAVAAGLLGMLILVLLIGSYDQAPAADRANFETADITVVVMPFVTFFLAAIAALSITGEFATGTIGPSLLAVPRRRDLLRAKVAVAMTGGFGAGLLIAAATTAGAMLLLGARPAPLNPWPHWSDAVPTVLSAAVVVMVTSAVAAGLGTILRSTATTLVTLGGLILVAPVFAHFLPTVWHLRFASVLLPNLTPQLAGGEHPYVFSPGGAAAVAAGYLVIALGAAAISLQRRDAS
ncbi:ABC-type transport system involved in multi-copper enzyme maturation permease subunit [Actinoplanes lutulentus]|uniref:ABC-2 family transporter n=1 Tax=Actinoplanes lutulentus TaxID=1287878 RepID=A0A327ZCC7_9ACTN|nr:ABC transporter permease [Actinoplanes lutulentus]MBB2947005.1 ABC-type transport system involved in multi-copper enzyme maturation permease subunit [Actinoplanes lutulentus]RAK30506.1 ABC-2 family transporter [Actinoplanes lutulentus]